MVEPFDPASVATPASCVECPVLDRCALWYLLQPSAKRMSMTGTGSDDWNLLEHSTRLAGWEVVLRFNNWKLRVAVDSGLRLPTDHLTCLAARRPGVAAQGVTVLGAFRPRPSRFGDHLHRRRSQECA